MVGFVIGDNPGDDFPGIEDCQIHAGSPTTNLDGFGLEVTKYGVGDHRHLLLAASGISSLPSSLTVNSASMYLYLNNHPFDSLTQVQTIRRMLRAWGETTATYNTTDGSTNWTTPGALDNGTDRSATITGTMDSLAVTGWQSFSSAQLAADIEGMADGSLANYGWHRERTDAENDFTYRVYEESSGTSGLRPYLVGDYTAGGGGASITGDVTSTISSNAAMAFNQHPSVTGDVTATIISNATMAFNRHYSINGDVTATLTSNAVLEYNQHPGISGDVTATISANAAMAYSQDNSIKGDVTVNVTSGAAMAFNRHPAISGDVTTTVTANATMAFNSGASITGDVMATISSDAAMQYNLHRSFVGDTTTIITPAAAMLYTSAAAPLRINDGGETVIVREPKRKEKERPRFEVTLEPESESEQKKPAMSPVVEKKKHFNASPFIEAFMAREYAPVPVELPPNPAIVVDMARVRDEMAAKASEQAIEQALFEQRRTEAAAWHQRLLQEDEEILLIIAAS